MDQALIDRLLAASAGAPLAPEPFLVRGVQAQLSGNGQLAMRSFLAARQRNPRAVAARYFLADLYLKAGMTGPGLGEISALARLVPQSLPTVAPYLAAYAKTASAAPLVKAMLDGQPQLEPVLLNELAADAANAKLIGYLWSGRGGEVARPWQSRLVNGLVDAGRFSEARTAWARFTGISADQDRIYDPEFQAQAPPPFGWLLASGASGIADPQADGLHILYYGRDDLVLASQLMTLSPGSYRLTMQVKASLPVSNSLSWTIHCLPSSSLIAAIPLERSGAAVAPVDVPASGCAAQRIELVGTAREFPQQAEVLISRLRLERDRGQ